MMGWDHAKLGAPGGLDELEVLEVVAGCLALDALRVWGAAIIDAFQGMVLVLASAVT